MTREKRSTAISATLVAVCAVLGWWIFVTMNRPPPSLDFVASSAPPFPPDAEETSLPAYEPRPVEQFIAALDRPLFRSDRRPGVIEAEPVAAVVPERSQPLEATLLGVLLADGQKVALLKPNNGSTTFRVSEGEIFLGWRLLEVLPEQVVLGKDEEQVTLTLVYKAGPPPPPRRR